LRAPLRAINGFGNIVNQEYSNQLDPEGQRIIHTICSETMRMAQLIDGLLEFVRCGRMTMQQLRVEMASMAQRAFDECVAQVPGRDIQLKLHPLPATQGDSTLLRQVWDNLISNAVKYTRTKSVAEIEITGHVDGDELVYCVKDNGVGFDMQYAHKLFGVFQRLHSEAEFEGAGVGLALVQRIVERHGGRIWAEAKPDEGATLYFTLPAKRE
jgi:light-regulated signal transduction histidine kinase (bacteriophytochrome)